jgi:uncharacterized membrane protein YdbT with pleckstrin-like domain
MENQKNLPEDLGGKTLLIFFIKRSPLIVILLLLFLAINFSRPYFPENYSQYGGLAVGVFAVIFFIFAAIALLTAWLESARYKIFLTDESIKINRGILSEEQIGVPYRRVQDATIKRSLGYQLIGASALILNVIGDEGAQSISQETKIILPALDEKIALKIQDVILKKAEVEEMSMQQNSAPVQS